MRKDNNVYETLHGRQGRLALDCCLRSGKRPAYALTDQTNAD